MHKSEKIMLTNMCMIYDTKGNVLVQNRKKSWLGIAFPGGHVEPGELIIDSTIREVKEETGLDVSNLELCGIKQWFKPDEGRNICFLYKTCSFSGTVISTDEGENQWVKLSEIKTMNLAHTFDSMLDIFLNDNLTELYLLRKDEELRIIEK